ncbi:hypothetical protein DL96DRAFT_1810738 [Flagelloscypha sp. PMI_526]|nr:hypothetical protein DL96DRAFT_1810738 [Flagelloscypha sp. PMI_526]
MSSTQTSIKLQNMLREARTGLQGLQKLLENWPTYTEQFLEMGILDFFFELLCSNNIPWDIPPDDVPVPYIENHSPNPIAARAQISFRCLGRLSASYSHLNLLPSRFCRTILKGWTSLLHWSTFFMNIVGIPKANSLKISGLVADTWAALINSNKEYFAQEVVAVPGAFELYSRVWFSAINNPNEDGTASKAYYVLCCARIERGDNPALDFFRANVTTPSVASSTILSRLFVLQDFRNPSLLCMKFIILMLFSDHSREFSNALVRHGIVLKSVEFLGMMNDPPLFSNPHLFSWIMPPFFKSLMAWIRAGDGTIWMKRALRAGLIRKTLLSLRFYGQDSRFQELAYEAKQLIKLPVIYCTHPRIQPIFEQAYRDARACCDDLSAQEDTFEETFQYAEQAAKETVTLDGLTLAQLVSMCYNDDCQSRELKLRVCSKCCLVQYCSHGCQKRHWKIHRHFCRKYLPETATEIPATGLVREDRLNQCRQAVRFIQKPEHALINQQIVTSGEDQLIVATYQVLPAFTNRFTVVPFRSSDLAKAYGFTGNVEDFNWKRRSVVYDRNLLHDLSTRVVHIDLSSQRIDNYAMRTHIVIGLDRLAQ